MIHAPRKAFLALLVSISVIGIFTGSSPIALISPVSAAAVGNPVIYEIESAPFEATMPGCMGTCPPGSTFIPSYKASTSAGISAIANASKIDSFSTSNWDPVTQTQVPYEGGCALVDSGVKCWGGNNYGQLGDETTTNSLSPVIAKDSGVALTGVTDVVTNGTTTCVVQAGALKCVGMGNWPELSFESMQITTRFYTVSTATWSSQTGEFRYRTLKDGVVINTTTSASWSNSNLFSKNWITLISSGVSKVQLGANTNSTPTMCVMKTDGVAQCATIIAGTSSSNNASATTFDCNLSRTDGDDNDGYESATSCTDPVSVYKSKSFYTSTTSSATWSWTDAGLTGVTDISMTAESWGANNLCAAAAGLAVCRTFTAGGFGTKTEIEGSEATTNVYVTSGWGPSGLCVYAAGTIKCGAGTSTQTGTTAATKVVPVAVMERPLSIFYGSFSNMQKLFFVLPSGILSADQWILSCNSCNGTSSNVVSPVSAFTAATQTNFFNLTSVTGATDSIKYIPVTVETGTRRTRSLISFSVKTQSGEAMVGTSVRWTAPDAPGTLSSSATSTLSSDATGTGRVTVTTGPVMFTLSGGSVASGATLQAANIVTMVGESGNIAIVLPDPPAVVQRKISVILPDSSAVPSATVVMKNTYLMYGYSNTGASTSSWSSRPKDAKGYLGQMSCAYCFVAPPVYITGTDGSVTFPSFNPTSRSSSYDANVSYDDGELNQTVKSTFTSLTQTVTMPFMAKVNITIADADPTTPQTEVVPAADGSVDVPVEIADEDGKGISEITVATEEVCDQADTGGLWTSTIKIDSICSTIAKLGSTPVKSAGVRAAGVSAAATCTSSNSVKTDSAGKGTVKICFSASKKVRIRSKGVLASKPFCVVVGGIPCGATVANPGLVTGPVTTAPPSYTPAAPAKITSIKKGKTLSLAKVKALVKTNSKAGKITYKAAGACTIKRATVVASKKKGTCKITVAQAKKGKYKGMKKTVSFKIL